MANLYWPRQFSDEDRIEDRWEEARGLRIRRYIGKSAGSVIEAIMELGYLAKIPKSDPNPQDRTRWREYTEPACTRCGLILPNAEHRTRIDSDCTCPRCGNQHFRLTSYEVAIDGAPFALRSRLAKRLAGVYDEGQDHGTKLLAFRTSEKAGMYMVRTLRLGPGCLIPVIQGDEDYDIPRCVSCGHERVGFHPIGSREHCPSCGNSQWSLQEYRVVLHGCFPSAEEERHRNAEVAEPWWPSALAHCLVWGLLGVVIWATVGGLHR